MAKSQLSRLAAHAARLRLLARSDRVLAAVSGGADSVCLAHWLTRLRAKGRLGSLGIVHFHHGLRGRAADADARSVRRLAAGLEVPFILEHLPARAAARRERRSLEDAGRSLRYKALARLARAGGFTKVALGHHADDQAETVLLHLLRGTQVRGLAGIPPRRPLPGSAAEIVRPLLALSRSEVRGYCRAFGLRWREDASNRDTGFTRNWVRRRLIPLLESRSPRVRAHLAAFADSMRQLQRRCKTDSM